MINYTPTYPSTYSNLALFDFAGFGMPSYDCDGPCDIARE